MDDIPIALQLFAVRGEVKQDLPATLRKVADTGYVGAEPWGYTGEALEWMGHSAEDIRAMYDDTNLVCCGIHLATVALKDNLETTVEFNRILGNRCLVIAADPRRMSSVETIRELADILNDAAEKVAEEGMFVGYHAHGFDFEEVEGEVAWVRLFDQTSEEVIMQLDIGNCMGGGGDPIAMLKRFPNRARSIHLKDHNKPEGGVLGDGDVDWETVFEVIERNQNTRWFVVEEGGSDGLGFEVPGRSLQALRDMGL